MTADYPTHSQPGGEPHGIWMETESIYPAKVPRKLIDSDSPGTTEHRPGYGYPSTGRIGPDNAPQVPSGSAPGAGHSPAVEAWSAGRRRAEALISGRLEDEQVRVTSERWIRAVALSAAVTQLPARGDLGRDADVVLDLADRFEVWIRDGRQDTP